MAQKKLGRGLGALVELQPAADDGTARIRETIRGAADQCVLAVSGRTVEDFFRATSRVTPPEPQRPASRTAAATAETAVLASPPATAPRGAAETAVESPAPAPSIRAPSAAVREPAPMDVPDDDAREVQYSLFDPPVGEATAAETDEPSAPVARRAAPPPPPSARNVSALRPAAEPVAPSRVAESVKDEPQSESAIDDPVFVDDVMFVGETSDAPPPAPIPAAVARPPAPPTPALRAPEPAPEPSVVDDTLFLDESVGGIVLPDVELE